MHQIKCPWCGIRDDAEFTYRGDASVQRPAPEAGIDAFNDFIYTRDNPRGWHIEWWHHTAGCRQHVKVVRHTMTHEIHATGKATDTLEVPSS